MTREIQMTLPLSEADVRGLELGDMVYLTGEIVSTAGIPAHERILEHLRSDQPLPVPLAGAALFHLGSYNVEEDGELRVLYLNPTTSTRFNPLMPEIIRGYGLRVVGGKGGLDDRSARAMAEAGCVYLSILGGGAPIHSAAIRRVVDVAWGEMIAHYRLVRLEVARLGPLTVAIDAQGNSLYDNLVAAARQRRTQILERLKSDRDAAAR